MGDGYGVAAPKSGIVMAAAFVNVLVPVGIEVTVRRKLVLAVYWPSLTFRVMLAEPDWPAAGVTVTVRLAPLPPSAMLPCGTRVGFEEALLKARLARAVSGSPMVKLSGPVELSTPMLWLPMLEIVGGSLIAFTVTTKLLLALYCPSLTITVIVAVPFWFAAGVTVTVRFAPAPPNTTLATGTRVGLDEPRVKIRFAAAVSASPMVKPSAPVEVSSSM